MAKKQKKTRNANVEAGAGGAVRKKDGLLIYVPAFCSLVGTLMLLAVILTALPLTVPQYMGYEIYDVVSGSMEPSIPIGSVIYVKPTDPLDVEKGDIIAYRSGENIIMHRVVINRVVEGTFTTKGDANNVEDLFEVPYENLTGIVVRHIPVLGQVLILFASTFGRICMICFAACGALLNILGNRFRETLEYERKLERRREEMLARMQAENEERQR
ncbi:MAG: signal peptidase I [Eubacteriales bacterium]|nr:signal peptidase I [Eubacteriales bacterium]